MCNGGGGQRRDRAAELLGLVPEVGPSTPADALPVEPAFVMFALVKIGQTFGKAFDPGDPFGHKMGTKLPSVLSANCQVIESRLLGCIGGGSDGTDVSKIIGPLFSVVYGFVEGGGNYEITGANPLFSARTMRGGSRTRVRKNCQQRAFMLFPFAFVS